MCVFLLVFRLPHKYIYTFSHLSQHPVPLGFLFSSPGISNVFFVCVLHLLLESVPSSFPIPLLPAGISRLLCCYASREWFNNSAPSFLFYSQASFYTTVTCNVDSYALIIPTHTRKWHPHTDNVTQPTKQWRYSTPEFSFPLFYSFYFIWQIILHFFFFQFLQSFFFHCFSFHLFTIVKINLSLQGFTFDIYKCNV